MNGIWQDGQFVLASTFEERLERSNALLKQSEARARELFEALETNDRQLINRVYKKHVEHFRNGK